MTGIMVGTPLYLAPEVWVGEAADERSDIYALGATLYFMLAERVPFEAAGPRLRSQITAPVFPGPSSASLRELDGILARALAHNPAERFASATEFRQALEQLRKTPDFAGPVGERNTDRLTTVSGRNAPNVFRRA